MPRVLKFPVINIRLVCPLTLLLASSWFLYRWSCCSQLVLQYLLETPTYEEVKAVTRDILESVLNELRLKYNLPSRTGKAPATLLANVLRGTVYACPSTVQLVFHCLSNSFHSLSRSFLRMFYTRRPPTLSINELNQIITESLDIERFENLPAETIIHHDSLPSTPEKPKYSTFYRLFSRSSTHLPVIPHSPTIQVDEPVTPSPRKMAFTWRLPRLSPQRSRSAKDNAPEGVASVPVGPSNRSRSSSVTSAVPSPSRPLTSMSSTSSLGSVIPTSERFLKHDTEEIVCTEAGNVATSTRRSPSPSPVAIAHSRLFPTQMAYFPPAPRSPLQLLFGNKSLSIVPTTGGGAMSSADVVEKRSDTSVAECTDVESIDDDITPRATEFTIPPHRRSDSTVQAKQRRRPSALTLVLPPQETTSLCLRPAIGVSPHVPSDTDGSVSTCSLPSPTLSIPTSCQPSSYVSSVLSSALASSTSSIQSPTSTTSCFPWSRARAGSRSMQTPPLPGPPPSCPLPPTPALAAQNPDFLTPQNMQVPLPTVNPSPSKHIRTSVLTGSPSGTLACLPPPSPGSLRLPSRLSWGATGRMVVPLPSSLPSPPSSPSKKGRNRELSSCSSTADQKNGLSNATSTLGKRASIGVLEAASDLEARVRRTKSILVLGTRRSKGTLSCPSSPPKRVQIHAEANLDTESSPKKPMRRKSSAACSVPFLTVPRERRRSAPLLRSGATSKSTPTSPACADWTLSLPFCIDVPGSGIFVPTPPSEDGALHEADEALQIAQGDDWTLSLGVDRQMVGEGVATHSTQIKNNAEEQCSVTTQLPTPSATPEPEDDIPPLPLPAFFEPFPRPDSPASLGPHGGGLDLDGGCGKRGSGWDACGWFGPSSMDESPKADTRPVSMFDSEASWVRRSSDTDAPRRSDVGFVRNSHRLWVRSPSMDSMATTCTADTVFYSARTSVFVI
ncbi:uncharacterized protein EDB91DRAFT_315036 [Suillus paluster]|uniref:uncharacterized protein n=1 Tax=Suillus paluster TaxID=48578 RepID=UPI001B864B09|nr:uncharacterized protein EDB91DRAFT_315036 [Suillus paluster]KAG1741794.1 hypothetical protein EDB91DRAFT_315036 [Suillus paluster]